MGKKKVNLFKMITFTVCGIIVLDTFVAPAAMGVSSITIWIITAIFFFIPYGLINAELGAAYPEDGGIFVWVKRAFGELQATLVGWYYWVNVAFWMPAVFIAFSTWFGYTFVPNMSLFASGIIAIFMCWVIVFIGIRGVELSVAVTNVAAICKVAVLVIFGLLGTLYFIQNGANNDFSFSNFIPSFDLNTFTFISAIVYNLLGFELISSIASEIEEPEKNIPKMTIMAGVIIAVLYIVGTFGVLVAIPAEQIDPLNGFQFALEELTSVFGSFQGIAFKLIMILTLFTLVSNMISWSMGGVEVLDAADFSKNSKILGVKHKKYNTPYGSYILMGVISTGLIILNFSLSGDANDAFWTILAFSFVIFLLPYLWLFPAAIKLRKMDASNRPYKVPGGEIGLYISAILGFFFIAISVFLLFYTGEFDILYHMTLIIGTAITTIIGLFLYKE
ncbi:MAG: APC family permease [Bacilli bacterium]